MAIKLTAVRGSLTVSDAYLLIAQISMTKYTRPVEQPDGSLLGVPDTQYVARVQMYADEATRISNFGAPDFAFAFTFDHVDGEDLQSEAYDWVAANGLPGWVFSGITQV